MKIQNALAMVQIGRGLRVDFGDTNSKNFRSSDELQKQRVLAASRIATDRESFIASLRDNDFFFVPEFEITKIVDLNVDVRDVRPNDFDIDFLKTKRNFGFLEQDEDPQSRSPRKTVLDDEPREEVFESFSEDAIMLDFEASGEGSGVDPMTTEATLTTTEEITTIVELWSSLSTDEELTTTTTGIQTTIQTSTTHAPQTRFNLIDKAAFFGNPVTTDRNQQITSLIQINEQALEVPPSVDVQCSAKNICVEFTKSYLVQHWHMEKWWGLHFSELCNELHVYEDDTTFKMCLGDENTSDFLNCGTRLSTNATHAVFSNHVTHFFPQQSVTPGLEVGTFGTQKIFEWKCSYPLQMVHSSDVLYKAQNKVKKIVVDSKNATGKFGIDFEIYADENYTDLINLSSPLLDTGNYLNMKVVLEEPMDGTHLQVVSCWATPTEEIYDENGFEFFQNYCSTPLGSQIEMSISENGASSEVLWRSRVFKFTNSELVYMHCDVNVCIESEENSCAVECSKSRSPRSGDHSSYTGQNVVSLGPIRFTGYSKAEYLIIDPATGLVDEREVDASIDAEFNFINHFLIALITLITMVMLVAIYGATRKCPTEDSTLA